MNTNTYRGHRFPPTIIQLTVWMYARFALNIRDKAFSPPLSPTSHRAHAQRSELGGDRTGGDRHLPRVT